MNTLNKKKDFKKYLQVFNKIKVHHNQFLITEQKRHQLVIVKTITDKLI